MPAGIEATTGVLVELGRTGLGFALALAFFTGKGGRADAREASPADFGLPGCLAGMLPESRFDSFDPRAPDPGSSVSADSASNVGRLDGGVTSFDGSALSVDDAALSFDGWVLSFDRWALSFDVAPFDGWASAGRDVGSWVSGRWVSGN